MQKNLDILKETAMCDFPGSPVVKTPRFQCRELRVQLLVRELRSHMRCGKAKNKIKKDCHSFKLDSGHDEFNMEQGCSKDYEKVFPLLTNTSGEIEITFRGATSKF